MRYAFLALLAALVPGAAAAAPTGAFPSRQPILYRIDGYLDHAPPGTPVLERVTLGFAGRSRRLLLTAYQRFGDRGDPWLLTNNLGAYHPDFLLIGGDADIARILDAPAGARLRGSFQYLPFIHSLVIDPHAPMVEDAEPGQ